MRGNIYPGNQFFNLLSKSPPVLRIPLLEMLRRLVSPIGESRLLRFILLAVLVLSSGAFGAWYLWLRERQPICSGDFDLVIVAAEIIDGLGGPPYKADIGIRNKRIACVGRITPTGAGVVIDGSGLSVAPGFIDVHTHVERNVPESSAPFLAHNFVRQGVTTLITGNCGRSFLDIGKLFSRLEKNGAEVNVASFLGHNTIRLKVMKESAAIPNPAQLAEMKALVRSGMHEGALGLSTGLEYIPGTFAKTQEIVELASIVAESKGIYVSHIRDEGPNGEAAIREAIAIGDRAGTHVHISHFKAQGPNQWGSAQARLDLIKSAEQRGLTVSLDQYPYTASSTNLAILLPSRLSEGGLSNARHKLSNPLIRKQIRAEMLAQLRLLGWRDYSFARVAYCGFDHSLIGLNIEEITQRRSDADVAEKRVMSSGVRMDIVSGINHSNRESELERQADTVMDLFSRGDMQMIFFNMKEEDVETIMGDPEVMFGSDSGVRDENASVLPHPRGLGTFPRILGVYAREKHLFALEEGVRRMTSLPAATFGLKDRGRIREGAWADLVVFDRNRIHDTATYDQPLSYPEGIYYVIVNGSVVLDKGRITMSVPGAVIRGNQVEMR